jgi:hypothetical protein
MSVSHTSQIKVEYEGSKPNTLSQSKKNYEFRIRIDGDIVVLIVVAASSWLEAKLTVLAMYRGLNAELNGEG